MLRERQGEAMEGNTAQAWPERYRPDDVEGMALAPDVRQQLERYLTHGLSRHLILHGPPGMGKTTIARILRKRLYVDLSVMSVKATETGNVEFIRRSVLEFIRSMSLLGGSKLLIFEEASGLSREGQETLRVPLEDWADLCRVIFITNNLSKLDLAVQSRCDVIEMARPPLDECARVLGEVLMAEGVDVEPRTVREFTSGHFAGGSEDDHRDLRTLLASAQHSVETAGTLVVPPGTAQLTTVEMIWQGTEVAEEEVKDGAKILNDLASEFSKYLSLPYGGVEALALWTVFVWAHEAFSISPILTLLSPTPRAGKSTVFEMLEQLLIPDTYHPSSLTPAVVFRLKGRAEAAQAVPSSEPEPPTLCLLMDEADNWLGLQKELRGILNSGHARRSAISLRMVGTDEVGRFSTWYPKALALVNRPASPLPDTIKDRSIIIPMQRKRKGEELPKFPRHRELSELSALRDRVAPWVREHFDQLRDLGGGKEILAAQELNDRAQDNWQPLMAIARLAGGDWEKRAQHASLILSDTTGDTELLIELLEDIKQVFEAEELDQLRSVALVQKLQALEDGPWKDMRLSATKMSKMLRPLRIRPRQLWVEVGVGKKANIQGYRVEHFQDAFSRYL